MVISVTYGSMNGDSKKVKKVSFELLNLILHL